MAEIVETLEELLRVVSRHVFAARRDASRQYGLTMPTAHLLGQVMHEPGVTVSGLSRRSGMAKSHISKSIEGLAALGFVEKRTDEADQRLLRVYPTALAEEHFKQMHSAVQSHFAAAVSKLPSEQILDVIKGLQLLKTALEQGKTES